MRCEGAASIIRVLSSISGAIALIIGQQVRGAFGLEDDNSPRALCK
jgi:hypothetical protein